MSWCGHKWEAPYAWPPGVRPGTFVVPGLGTVTRDRKTVPQECSLPRGHEGPHRSLSNVTCEQRREPS